MLKDKLKDEIESEELKDFVDWTVEPESEHK